MRIWLIIMLLLIPFTYASIEECQRVTLTKNIPCQVISSWTPSGSCSDYYVLFYNLTNHTVLNMTWGEFYPYCNVSFNISTKGVYTFNSSIENGIINVEAEDNMTSLGIIIFLLLLNVTLFWLPFKVMFVKDIVSNEIIKKIMWTLALVILAFNTTILVTLADNAGLGINDEIFLFQWIFLKAIYIAIIWVVWSLITSIPKIYSQQKTRKRMGEHEE